MRPAHPPGPAAPLGRTARALPAPPMPGARPLAPGRRARCAALPALAALAALLMVGIAPASAKEALEARLDAPVALGTPGGVTIAIGLTLTVLDGDGPHPVEDARLFVRLVGRDGSAVVGPARPDAAAGHYTATIRVPEGGPRRLYVSFDGSDDPGIMLVGEVFVAGPISARTAQVAAPGGAAGSSPTAAGPGPAGVASAPAAEAVPPGGPADPDPAADSTAGGPPMAVLPLGALAAALLAILAVAVRRARARTRVPGRLAGP